MGWRVLVCFQTLLETGFTTQMTWRAYSLGVHHLDWGCKTYALLFGTLVRGTGVCQSYWSSSVPHDMKSQRGVNKKAVKVRVTVEVAVAVKTT